MGLRQCVASMADKEAHVCSCARLVVGLLFTASIPFHGFFSCSLSSKRICKFCQDSVPILRIPLLWTPAVDAAQEYVSLLILVSRVR